LAKQVSIPAEPGADTGMVNSFSVLKIVFKPSLMRFIQVHKNVYQQCQVFRQSALMSAL
jgi:hypothetical protein